MGATRKYSHIPNYPADLTALIAFADAVVKNRKYSGAVETSTDPKILFHRWKSVVTHKHGGAVECRVQYLPEGGGEIEGARFFAYNNIDGEAWQSVDVKLVVNEAERDDRPERNYAGVRRLLGL